MFTIGDKRVVFRYRYDSNHKPIATECRIEWAETSGHLRSLGLANCNPIDQFSRNIGRKLALARALHNLPRDERAQYWQAYLAARGGKW